jgi:radical SAM superfamily enzyme YgiQ (UPF0313 family)
MNTKEQMTDTVAGEEAFLRAQECFEDVFKGRVIKKVLLVNPPDIEVGLFDYSLTKRGRSNNYPPYGLGVLARHLMDNGYEVRVCNLNHEILAKCQVSEDASQFDFETTWRSRLTREFEEFQPDLVGATCLFTVTHPSFIQVGKLVKSYEASWIEGGEIPLVLGGVHVTHDEERILTDIPEADFLFLNESELSFLNFIEVVNGKKPPQELGQMIVNHPSGRLQFSKDMRPQSEDLSVIPAFELLDLPELAQVGTLGSWYGFKEKGTRIATVLSNRGCRAACTFCNVRTFNGVGVRGKTVDSVLEELRVLKFEHGIGHVIWLDDDLLNDEKRATDLFNGMVQKNLQLTWDATNGVIASSCKHDVIAAATESGCIGMYFGIESGSNEILKSVKKPGNVDTFLKAAEVLQKFEQINTKGFLMMGFPGESLSMIFDTISLAEQMNLDWNNIAILQPWKATPIYSTMVEEGLLDEEGQQKTGDNKFAPYNLGPYSRQRAIESGKIASTSDYEEILGSLRMDQKPDPQYLDDVWFYMNYRINFHRLFREHRQTKLEQGLKWLEYLHTLSAPDNAFIMYFYGLIQHRLLGQIEPTLIEKLDKRLEVSVYWRERLEIFGLSSQHLKEGVFPDGKNGGSFLWKVPEPFALPANE